MGEEGEMVVEEAMEGREEDEKMCGEGNETLLKMWRKKSRLE